MANPYNGSKNGKRGGRKHIAPSFSRSIEGDLNRFDVHNSTSHLVANGTTSGKGKSYSPGMMQIADILETTEDHLIPRQSLSDKQNLQYNRRPLEGVVVKACKHLVINGIPQDNKTIIARDIKVTRMSDKTLLKQGNPFLDPKDTRQKIKRQASRSKRITTDKYVNWQGIEDSDSPREIILDLDLDNDLKK